jgi:SanA protein
MNETVKKIIKAVSIIVGAAMMAAILADIYVAVAGAHGSHDKTADLPPVQAVLVLGASVLRNGQMSDVFADRARAALDVYRQKIAQKILVSGSYRQGDYDEVNAAKKFFLDNGVKKEDMFVDYAGFDTYSSVYRAKENFQVKSMIISTQGFHLPRALFIARSLGIETSGIKADRGDYNPGFYNILRENAARAKAFWDILTNFNPETSGQPIPITGDGRASWK